MSFSNASDEVKDIATRYINNHHSRLANVTIIYLFNAKTIVKKGKEQLGEAKLVSGLNAYLATRDLEERPEQLFVMTISKSAWDLLENNLPAREALIDHELCFPAETTVAAGAVAGAMKRRYTGELIKIRTAAGYQLSGTPEHPILTDRGWVKLSLLQEGMNVVSSGDAERVARLMYPDEHQVPSRIEEVFRSRSIVPSFVPKSAKNFNTYVADNEIDIVRTDRNLLANPAPAKSFKQSLQFILGGRDRVLMPLSRLGHLGFSSIAMVLASPGLTALNRPFDQSLLFFGASEAQALGIGLIPDNDSPIRQTILQRDRFNLKLLPKGIKRLAGLITFNDRRQVNLSLVPFFGSFSRKVGEAGIPATPNGDAASEQSLLERINVNAKDLLETIQRRTAGVSLDQIVNVDSCDFSGHVFNLETQDHWYSANGILAHNCHLDRDLETGALSINPHDIEEFFDIVRRHGAWTKDVHTFIESVRNAKTPMLPFDLGFAREQVAKAQEPDEDEGKEDEQKAAASTNVRHIKKGGKGAKADDKKQAATATGE